MSKNKFAIPLIATILLAGCNTQQAEAPPNTNPNARATQSENDDNRATAGDSQRGQAAQQTGPITQITVDADEFTELFGDISSITNPSPANINAVEEYAATLQGDDREELEENIQQCKSAPARCEILSEL